MKEGTSQNLKHMTGHKTISFRQNIVIRNSGQPSSMWPHVCIWDAQTS